MNARHGSVVVVVVWSIAIAAVMVAATQIVSYRQAVVGRESLARVEARWAARAGLEQMIAIMEFHAANPDPDDPMAAVRDMEEHALGDAESGTWSITHFLDGVEWAGPRDEGAKLNINVATKSQLVNVPNMTPDVVDAIIDWRDENDDVEGLGAEGDYYANRGFGYEPRNGPFRSIAELELVAGAWPKYVRGEDWNLNGRLDPNENDGPRTFPGDKPDGKLDAGWSQYLTAASRQSRVSTSGNKKFDLGSVEPQSLMELTGVDESQAAAIAAWGARGNARPETLLVSSLSQLAAPSAPRTSSGGRSSGGVGGSGGPGGGSGGGSGGGRPGAPGGSSGGRGGEDAKGSGSMAQANQGSGSGGGSGQSGRSSGGRPGSGGAGQDAARVRDLDASQLRAMLRESTADDHSRPVPGRININTAPEALLKEVLDIEPRVADAIIARRKASPTGIVSIADLQGMSGLDPGALVQLARQFDVTSSVYTVTSRGRSASTGTEVEIEAVVDRSEIPAVILSYRER